LHLSHAPIFVQLVTVVDDKTQSVRKRKKKRTEKQKKLRVKIGLEKRFVPQTSEAHQLTGLAGLGNVIRHACIGHTARSAHAAHTIESKN
jgi:hypothetical protein